jgi:gamma-glutamyltranspeptidase/glutathione hydrolase
VTAAAATSDPRATAAAAAVLREGGNAVDAAVTAALVLYVVEPQSCGVGGDGFLIAREPGSDPVALDGSGQVPAGLTAERLAADGFDAVPARGGASVTTPGAIPLLETALDRFGTRSLAEAVQPAVVLATEGFEVRPTLSAASQRAADALAEDPVLGPLYSPSGEGLEEGATVVNPDLASCLALVGETGSRAILEGQTADAIVEAVARDGGYLVHEDLAAHRTSDIELESIGFAGHTVWALPAPTQGPAVLAALRRIDEVAPVDWEAALAAMRAAMAEAGFDPAKVVISAPNPAKGDTTYLAVVDQWGRAASLITSVFGDFGAHLGIEAIGGSIHNRATTFRLVGRPPRPGKPPHTTIPGLVTGPRGLYCALGVAGGVMQPQTQVQLILRMLLENHSPQQAIDAPRFKICFGGGLALEEGHELTRLDPSAVDRSPGPEGFGAAQVVAWHEGELAAGADPRRGGSAVVIDGPSPS